MTSNTGSSNHHEDNNNNNSNKDNEDYSNKKQVSPFSQFDITSTSILDEIPKQVCPICSKNVRYFCNKCLKLVPNCPPGSVVPQLKLPIRIDVIKHENERDGKSTALHAKILAPDHVDVYGWKSMPKYENVDRLLLLFPSPGAKTLSEIDPESFDKLVVIDGTWEQANKMSKSDSPLLRMKRVTIAPHETLFWRHQRKTDDHLATIEAIYYFLREYHETYLSSIPESLVQDNTTAKKKEEDKEEKESTSLMDKADYSSSIDDDKESSQSLQSSSSSATNTTTTINTDKDEKDSASKVITPHKEWIDSRKLGPYTNQFDDMLWFYKYFYELIQNSYRQRTDGREFTLKHKKGYIQYNNKDGNNGNEDVGGEEGGSEGGKEREGAVESVSGSKS